MDFIELIKDKGIEHRLTNNPDEVLLFCSSGEHKDNSPSLSMNLDKKIFQCWSCGFKGSMVKFLESIGIQDKVDLDTKQPYKIKKLKDKITRIIESAHLEIPEDAILVTGDFKGIDVSVLRDFGAFTTQTLDLTKYMCIPVYQYGKLRFIEGRLTEFFEKEPKYKRKPFGAPVLDCLFPLDRIKNTNTIILVEGIFDMLNMHQLGYTNTLCIFGTNNFNATKVKLLDRLGITHVEIMMDPDVPGQKAAQRIADLLDKEDISSRILDIPEGHDPGSINAKQAKAIFNS